MSTPIPAELGVYGIFAIMAIKESLNFAKSLTSKSNGKTESNCYWTEELFEITKTVQRAAKEAQTERKDLLRATTQLAACAERLCDTTKVNTELLRAVERRTEACISRSQS